MSQSDDGNGALTGSNIRRLRLQVREGVRLDAILCHGREVERAVITDVSQIGLGLSGSYKVKRDAVVTVQVANGRQFDARVRWRTDERCGLEFLKPIFDLDEIMKFNAPMSAALPSVRAKSDASHGFIGSSDDMQSVRNLIARAGRSDANVFIIGESGTGKEICAEAIHCASSRKSKPFVAVNCAAIPRDLFESEIFGHVKGSYTGATSDRLGAALDAQGGTLFLDEIGELDIALQSKLLRFVQNRKVKRLGEDRVRDFEARIVCATNRDPRADVAAGRFREDLFYRLFVIPIRLPPLRERGDDVIELASSFALEYAATLRRTIEFDNGAITRLLAHSWPGNVRELQNLIRCLCEFVDDAVIDGALVDQYLQVGVSKISVGGSVSGWTSGLAPNQTEVEPLELTIQRAIDCAIAVCGGSIPRAAQKLEISPSTIYRQLQSRSQSTSNTGPAARRAPV